MAQLSDNKEHRAVAQRIAGIDALRFVLAIWVVLWHSGAALTGETWSRGAIRYARLVINNAWDGPGAAVIAFFVISGFCIHYPFRRKTSVDLISFYARRQVRILIPVAGALGLAKLVRLDLWGSVLWSLVCEEIYYVIYPLLHFCGRRFGWTVLVVMSYVAAFAVALTNAHASEYPSFGYGLNWVLGLPCWLLGARLAARCDESRYFPSVAKLWAWRIGVWFMSIVVSILRFHFGVGFPWTLNLFALVAVGWIACEIALAARRGAPILEPLGVFSYSLYLVHVPAHAIWGYFAPNLNPAVNGVAFCGFSIAFAYVFYVILERPSHMLARQIYGVIVARRAQSPVPAEQLPRNRGGSSCGPASS